MRYLRTDNIPETTVVRHTSYYTVWYNFVIPVGNASEVGDVSFELQTGYDSGFFGGNFWVKDVNTVGFVEEMHTFENIPDWQRVLEMQEPDTPAAIRIAIAAWHARCMAYFLANFNLDGVFQFPKVYLPADAMHDPDEIWSLGETNKYSNQELAQ